MKLKLPALLIKLFKNIEALKVSPSVLEPSRERFYCLYKLRSMVLMIYIILSYLSQLLNYSNIGIGDA